MGILKRSTPKKTESKVIPDEKDGIAPYIEECTACEEEPVQQPAQAQTEGQLSVDVFQTADEIVIVAPIAGVTMEDLSINVTDEVLSIKGRRSFQFAVAESDYFTKECFWGNFSRSVILPEATDKSSIAASFKNGILTIRIKKTQLVKTRMIKIKEE